MALDVVGIIDAVTSRAGALGVFDQVNAHEPKNAPGAGVVCSVWVSGMRPVESSGLASVSVRVELQCRIQTSMLQEPQDGIDVRVLAAADALFTALIGGFTLNGAVRQVDVLGAEGESLRAEAGYLNQDNRLFRVMDVFVPLVVNDVHAEVA
jgi:hypothetical protein